MDFAAHPSFDDHEQVVFVADEDTGLAAIIAVHSTALGPAAGGCRMATYVSADAALSDALRLSQGMSYKNAMAGLDAGGGKAVLYRVSPLAKRGAIFEAFGDAVAKLGGSYITAEDVGTSVADMESVARRTRYLSGLPSQPGLAGGDPSPWTALGVFVSVQAALDRPLSNSRVAVQGLGSVGYKLCQRLHAAGAKLVVADINQDRVVSAQHEFGAESVSVDRIHAMDADVFSPNALGAILNVDTVPELGAPLVCGGANNQLASTQDGERLFARNIVYAPDYVVNAGGIINVMAEYNGEAGDGVESRVLRIGERVREILAQAHSDGRPANEIADRLARNRIGRGLLSAA